MTNIYVHPAVNVLAASLANRRVNFIGVPHESAKEVSDSLRLLQVDELALHNLHWRRQRGSESGT